MENAPVIITAKLAKSDQSWANGLRRAHFPPERNFLDAHVTLFQHLPPRHMPEIKSRLANMASQSVRPDAWLSGIMLMGRGVAYQIESPDLTSMREELAHAFQGLLIPQDQAALRLHITVQNKVEPPVAKALYSKLCATFEPRMIGISGFSAYYYRGGPWECIQSWNFRR